MWLESLTVWQAFLWVCVVLGLMGWGAQKIQQAKRKRALAPMMARTLEDDLRDARRQAHAFVEREELLLSQVHSTGLARDHRDTYKPRFTMCCLSPFSFLPSPIIALRSSVSHFLSRPRLPHLLSYGS